MTEGTDMIENVARAICRADPEVRMGDADGVVEQRVNIEWVHYVGAAKAAIAAMQQAQQEPVAWKNYAEDGDWWLTDDREPADSCERSVPLYTQPPVPQWQGIESAPMDGTWFLACDEDGNVYACAYYGAGFDDEPLWQVKCGQPAVRTPTPTHWMPLPTPPNGGSHAE